MMPDAKAGGVGKSRGGGLGSVGGGAGNNVVAAGKDWSLLIK